MRVFLCAKAHDIRLLVVDPMKDFPCIHIRFPCGIFWELYAIPDDIT